MTTLEDLEKAKSAAEKVRDGATFLNDYGKKAKELAASGGTLNQAQSLLATTKKFGQLANGLMMANVGLELAMMFMPSAPDPDELILKAVEELDNKVGGLWSSMDAQFKVISSQIEDQNARRKIEDELEYFSGLQAQVAAYQDTKSAPNMQDLLDESYDPADIFHRFHTIAQSLKSTDINTNALAASFKVNHGSGVKIGPMSQTFVSLALFAPMAYALSSALRHENDTTYALASAEDVGNKFDHLCDQVIDATNFWLAKCVHEEDEWVTKRIKKFIETEIDLPDGGVVAAVSDIFHSQTNALLSELEQLWPHLNLWVVIGSTSLTSVNTFTCSASHFATKNYIDYSHPGKNGPFMIAVFWDPSDGYDVVGRQWKNATLIKTMYHNMKDEYCWSSLMGHQLKGLLYEKGVGPIFKDLQEHSYQPVMSVGAAVCKQKDSAWSVATNRLDRSAFWFYPSWHPLTDASHWDTEAALPSKKSEPGEDPFYGTSGEGSEGIVLMLIA